MAPVLIRTTIGDVISRLLSARPAVVLGSRTAMTGIRQTATATAVTMASVTETILYRLTPIDPQVADRLRAENPDASRYVADARPGYPCRQCLRDAEIGDELILVSWDPFTADTPYRSASPIFLHKEPCLAPKMTALPEQLTVRQLSVRAFDGEEMMIDAAIVEGSKLDETLERFFAQPDCDHVHVHNATRGCWATRVDRVSAG
jgi:hypothetical protein